MVRRRLVAGSALLAGSLALTVCGAAGAAPAPTAPATATAASAPVVAAARPVPAPAPAPANTVVSPKVAAIVTSQMKALHLRSVVVKVTKRGKVVSKQAFGVSLDNQPARTNMYFRNGAVAFAYLGTLLMKYVDEGKVRLKDTVDKWYPGLMASDKVTLKMLANQTTGYPDFETDARWNAAYNANPFQSWGFKQRLDYAFKGKSMLFAPGSNWSYSHTNFMILGQILSKVGKKPLDVLLRNEVLKPMGLEHTLASNTGSMPSPTLHAFSSERRVPLGIPAGTYFYEESTSWNANWGTPAGASQATTIDDMARTASMVGQGKLLSKWAHNQMTGPHLLGFGHSAPNCAPVCFTQVNGYNYGLGVVRSGQWIVQNPLLGGYSAAEAYLPQEKVAVAVAVTFAPGAFSSTGAYSNAADQIWRLVGAAVVPAKYAPPIKK